VFLYTIVGMSEDLGIQRVRGNKAGHNWGTAYGELVWAAAVATDRAPDLRTQTASALASLDKSLAAMGSDRTRLLSATVYLADIARKAEMDEAWCAWIGDDPQLWPQRACVGVALAPGTLVEIAVVAVRGA
jgi:enamine deaminase RidA (YjgF/YER057c/UK114 family)